MNCDCKKKFEEQMIGKDHHGKKILKAELDSALVFSNPMKLYTTSYLKLTLEGRKTKVEIAVMHSYCPFCGKEAYPEEKEN